MLRCSAVDAILEAVRKHWGFDALRPLQREAMEAALAGRDALVVLPTGGGKSLCYQVPALLADGLTVVVSPLISLMKDQVDRLLSKGVPAAFLNSSLDGTDRSRVQAGIARGAYKLVFVAPERFAAGGFDRVLEMGKVRAFAIDEAHCISHWGHDFRVDYRELGRLKREFPGAVVHAFTATATPRVRTDIAEQLGLRDPLQLVGDFFRPNLNYRCVRRGDAFEDVLGLIRAHPGEAGIVYCIRRADVDDLAERLAEAGVKAQAYHAGMDDEERTRAQDRFAAREVDVVVATVAFGMGIDRADIRFVAHAAMPKSIEHYQQETGRAGRDGAPADCVLFHSGQDYQLWKLIIEKNEPSDAGEKLRMLSEMYGFATGMSCRHRRLVEYFGQRFERGRCGACDVCTNRVAAMEGSSELAKSLLEGVVRLGQRFGGPYVAEVLAGQPTPRVVERGHDQGALFGLLDDRPARELSGFLMQLVDQGALEKEPEYGVLSLTQKGARILRGEEPAVLLGAPSAAPRRKRKKAEEKARSAAPGKLASDDRSLFERLRELRRRIADEERVPAFMVFSDRTLRGMAQLRPRTRDELLGIHGVGEAKLEAYGDRFLEALRDA
jgi:ATP-dependent DNA helicase RecQ